MNERGFCLVTGSIFLVSEIMAQLTDEPTDGPVDS